mmetsp:Transcript_119449/g.254893  ORF Transcript_119449/g.254893 Transcript_119449/m.254893 type:complete len:217 (+) Transcript_119449:3963-4613(+)
MERLEISRELVVSIFCRRRDIRHLLLSLLCSCRLLSWQPIFPHLLLLPWCLRILRLARRHDLLCSKGGRLFASPLRLFSDGGLTRGTLVFAHLRRGRCRLLLLKFLLNFFCCNEGLARDALVFAHLHQHPSSLLRRLLCLSVLRFCAGLICQRLLFAHLRHNGCNFPHLICLLSLFGFSGGPMDRTILFYFLHRQRHSHLRQRTLNNMILCNSGIV